MAAQDTTTRHTQARIGAPIATATMITSRWLAGALVVGDDVGGMLLLLVSVVEMGTVEP